MSTNQNHETIFSNVRKPFTSNLRRPVFTYQRILSRLAHVSARIFPSCWLFKFKLDKLSNFPCSQRFTIRKQINVCVNTIVFFHLINVTLDKQNLRTYVKYHLLYCELCFKSISIISSILRSRDILTQVANNGM